MTSFSLGDILFILLVGGIVVGLLQLVSRLRSSRPSAEPDSDRSPDDTRPPVG